MARSCYILADYEAVSAYHLRDVSRARTQRLGERGGHVHLGHNGCPPAPGAVVRLPDGHADHSFIAISTTAIGDDPRL